MIEILAPVGIGAAVETFRNARLPIFPRLLFSGARGVIQAVAPGTDRLIYHTSERENNRLSLNEPSGWPVIALDTALLVFALTHFDGAQAVVAKVIINAATQAVGNFAYKVLQNPQFA